MQILISGLISGITISLLAIAFQVVYLPMRVFYIALAGIYSLAPFIVYSLHGMGQGWIVAILIALIVCIAGSIFCDLTNHALLTRRNASESAHLVTSLGIYIIIIQVISLLWGNEPKSFQTGLHTVFNIGDIVVTNSQLITISVGTLLISGYALFFTRTEIGLRFRALADNATEFALLGYNIYQYRLFSFAISGVLAASSSILVSFDVGFDPNLGIETLLVSVVAVIVGGTNSFWGPAIAGILLGILRAEVVWFLSAQWQDAVTFGFLVVFLYLRPQGLFGKKQRLETQL